MNVRKKFLEQISAGKDGFVDSDEKLERIFAAIEKAEKFGNNSNPRLTEIADSYDEWSCTKSQS